MAKNSEYQRALAIVNPQGTRARQVGCELAHLALWLPVTRVESSREPRRTRDAIHKEFEEGDVVLSAGGDGLFNQIINIVRLSQPEGQVFGSAVTVPLRGGYANEAAVMLNGRKTASHIVERGQKVALNPLEITITDTDGNKSTRWAASHFGAAGTGLAAQRIEDVKAQSSWLSRQAPIALVRKAVATWAAIAQHPEIKLTDGINTTQASDITVARGNKIAKYGNTHAHLGGSMFESFVSSPTGYLKALHDMVMLQRGKLYGDSLTALNFSVETPGGLPFYVHHDGEPGLVPSGSTIDIRMAGEGYNTLIVSSPDTTKHIGIQ